MSNNYAIMLEGQARHLAYILSEAKKRNAVRVEVTPEGEQGWTEQVERTSAGLIEYQKGCTPGYYNNEGLGAADAPTFQNETFAPGALVFNDILKSWRSDGKLDGLALS
jgi:cyclohexanone monooxygenase